jgi:hypothetical protein
MSRKNLKQKNINASFSSTIKIGGILAISILFLSMSASPASAGEGSIPKSSLEIFDGFDERLVGVPLGDTKYASSSQQLVGLEKNVESLSSKQATLTAKLSILQVEKIERERQKKEAATKYGIALLNHKNLMSELYFNSQIEPQSIGATIQELEDYIKFQNGKELINNLVLDSHVKLISTEKNKKKTAKKLTETNASIKSVQSSVGTLKKDLTSAQASVDQIKILIRDSLPVAPIDGLDIPVMTMDAYLRAEKKIAELEPSCSVKWWGIAGIGKTESNHGRFNGAAPDYRGNISPPVIGIALDGNGVAAIKDTDGGKYDNDTVWDRAVGPMQFIPQTWEFYARDNNGDGKIDPQNLYDTALATAEYMCASAKGLDLQSDAALIKAYLSYNHSSSYAALCLARGKNYKEAWDEIKAGNL